MTNMYEYDLIGVDFWIFLMSRVVNIPEYGKKCLISPRAMNLAEYV